jgi:hypothetical protein
MTICDLRWPARPRRSRGSEQADQRHRCSRWATKPQLQATTRITTMVAMNWPSRPKVCAFNSFQSASEQDA